MKRVHQITMLLALIAILLMGNEIQAQGRGGHRGGSSSRPAVTRPTQTQRPTTTQRPQQRPDYRPKPTPQRPGYRPSQPPPRPGFAPHRVVRPYKPHYIRVLPSGYRPYAYRGINYSFYGGIYYRPYGNTYIVCRPPVGFIIATAAITTAAIVAVSIAASQNATNNQPAQQSQNTDNSATTSAPTTVNQAQYFYSEGTFYVKKSDEEYEVVSPPIGAQVPAIPEDCEESIIDGKTYYKVDDTYFKTVVVAGKPMFEVVGKEVK